MPGPSYHGRTHLGGGTDPIPGITDSSGDRTNWLEAFDDLGPWRGWWRLGDASAPYLDLAGYVNGPYDLSVAGSGGNPITRLATGALPADVDDGAVQLNNASVSTSLPYLRKTGTGNSMWAGTVSGTSSFSFVGWLNPTTSATSFNGNIFSDIVVTPGSPPEVEGWQVYCVWPVSAGSITLGFRRCHTGAGSPFDNIATTTITVGSWHFIACVYDGALLNIYVDGVLATSTASTAALSNYTGEDPHIGGNGAASFYGGVDEVGFRAGALTAAEVLALYESVTNPNDNAAADQVWTADGAGNVSWAYPAILVEY